MKSVTIARNYLLGLVHLLLEGRIVRRQLVGPIGPFDQEEAFAIAGAQAIDHFLGKMTPSELPNLRTFSSIIKRSNRVITIVMT